MQPCPRNFIVGQREACCYFACSLKCFMEGAIKMYHHNLAGGKGVGSLPKYGWQLYEHSEMYNNLPYPLAMGSSSGVEQHTDNV